MAALTIWTSHDSAPSEQTLSQLLADRQNELEIFVLAAGPENGLISTHTV
jgi:hypothetical protein